MSAELVGMARTTSDKDKARKHPRLARASARLAVAVEALFDSDGWGGEGEDPRVSQVWEAIEAVISRADLRAALEVVTESTPPPDPEDPDWRAALVSVPKVRVERRACQRAASSSRIRPIPGRSAG